MGPLQYERSCGHVRPSVRAVPEWATIEPFFHPVPTLAAAPERFAAALREARLDRLREDSLSNPSQNQATLARIALLADAIRQSAADAAALIRRLAAIAQTAEQMLAPWISRSSSIRHASCCPSATA